MGSLVHESATSESPTGQPCESLYSTLWEAQEKCRITGRMYVPLDVVFAIITPEAVQATRPELSGTLRSRIPLARRVIAILVFIGQEAAIGGLLSDGLTDDDLPLPKAEGAVKGRSRSGSKTLSSLKGLNECGRNMFSMVQCSFLSPQFDLADPAAPAIPVPSACGLPLLHVKRLGAEGDADGGAKGDGGRDVSWSGHQIVYQGTLRPAHQLGPAAGRGGAARVAVKVFRGQADFAHEKDILDKIRAAGISSDHLVRHLAFCVCEAAPYIVFPWADGETLETFWATHPTNLVADGLLGLRRWSLRQICGLTQALHDLHVFNCRHGDMKPSNILHFTEAAYGILKIADLGESRIHDVPTDLRRAGTNTKASTLLYEAPEARKIGDKEKARSRVYDVWSMGCIILEFVVWLLHGHDAVKALRQAIPSDGSYYHTVRTADGSPSAAGAATGRNVTDAVRPVVVAAMDSLRQDPRARGTVLAALVELVQDKMLLVEPKERLAAFDLRRKMQGFLERAAADDGYLLRPIHPRPPTPDIFRPPSEDPDPGP